MFHETVASREKVYDYTDNEGFMDGLREICV